MYDKCCKNVILVSEITLFVFPVLFKISSFIDFQAATLGRKPRKTSYKCCSIYSRVRLNEHLKFLCKFVIGAGRFSMNQVL